VLVSNLKDDGVDAWKQFLNRGLIQEALAMCSDRKQKEYLAGIYADQLFDNGNYIKCAETYAISSRKFEDVCLKFLAPDRH
jgi:hypothetical protein